MPTVSVIIPSYNRGYIVSEAIDSVLAQSFEDFEVIVVDDGSTDDTAERIAAVRDPRVRYIRQANAGASAARNRGLAQVRGSVVSFLDSDDLWKPEKLECEVRFFEKHTDTDAVFADAEEQFLDGGKIPSVMRASPSMRKILERLALGEQLLIPQRAFYLMMLTEQPVKPPAFSLRKHTLDRLGGFNERMRHVEDWEFFLRLARHSDIGYINCTLATIRLSRDSMHLSEPLRLLDCALACMSRERKLLRSGDHEALAASTRGIDWICTFVSYQLQSKGERWSAIRASLRGYIITREPWPLLRAASLLLPDALRQRAKAFIAGRAPESV